MSEEVNVEIKDGRVYIGGRIYLELRKLPKRILVVEDKFKSSYDCVTCNGTGTINKTCIKCDGSGYVDDPDDLDKTIECGRCDNGSVTVSCKACDGKGALLVIPEIAKSKPTSGRIACIGPGCHSSNIGDRIAYTGYTGHLVPFKGNTRIRVMLEDEMICFVGDVEGSEKEAEEVYFVDKDNAYESA